MAMWGWTVNLNKLFLGRLRPPEQLTSTKCTYMYFGKLLTTALLESAEEETKVSGGTGYQTQDLWVSSQMHYRLSHVAETKISMAEWLHLKGFPFTKSLQKTNQMDRWMTCNLMSFSTVFQSYKDNGCVIMKGCLQWNLVKD